MNETENRPINENHRTCVEQFILTLIYSLVILSLYKSLLVVYHVTCYLATIQTQVTYYCSFISHIKLIFIDSCIIQLSRSISVSSGQLQAVATTLTIQLHLASDWRRATAVSQHKDQIQNCCESHLFLKQICPEQIGSKLGSCLAPRAFGVCLD